MNYEKLVCHSQFIVLFNYIRSCIAVKIMKLEWDIISWLIGVSRGSAKYGSQKFESRHWKSLRIKNYDIEFDKCRCKNYKNTNQEVGREPVDRAQWNKLKLRIQYHSALSDWIHFLNLCFCHRSSREIWFSVRCCYWHTQHNSCLTL
jgi:hypothetical protein